MAAALAALVVLGPPLAYRLRHRRDFAELRRVRRRVASEAGGEVHAVTGLAGGTDAAAEELLRDLCREADEEGRVCVAEVEADGRHAGAYPAAGFVRVATVPVPWGPRSSSTCATRGSAEEERPPALLATAGVTGKEAGPARRASGSGGEATPREHHRPGRGLTAGCVCLDRTPTWPA